jgi:hypothetical protein
MGTAIEPRYRLDTEEVTGSIPVSPTTFHQVRRPGRQDPALEVALQSLGLTGREPPVVQITGGSLTSA